MDQLEKEQGSDKLIKIQLRSNPVDDWFIQESKDRGIAFEQKGFPTIGFNGQNIYRNAMTIAEVDKAIENARRMSLSYLTSLAVTIKKEGIGTKILVSGTISQIAALGDVNLKYFTVLFEDGLERSDEEKLFNHIVRAMKPSGKGGSLRINEGETKSVSASFDLKEDWVYDNLGLALVVFDANRNEVFDYSVWYTKSPSITKGLDAKVPAGPLSISFSKPIDSSTFSENTVLLADEKDKPIAGTYAISENNCTFTPKSDLATGKKFTLYVKGGVNGVKSTDGNHLDEHYITHFEVSSEGRAVLSFNPTVLDFGEISRDTTKNITIINTGSGVLKGTAKPGSNRAEVDPTSFELAAEKSIEIKVTAKVDSAKPNERANCMVNIETNGGNGTVAFNFTRSDAPPATLKVKPTELDFGKVKLGTKSTLPVVIFNEQSDLISGTAISNQPWITIEPSSFEIQNDKNGSILNVTVYSQIEGDFTGNIQINTNIGTLDIPVKVKVILELTLLITEPNTKVAYKREIAIQGRVTPGSSVTINGTKIGVSTMGSFMGVFTINPGPNKFEVVATLDDLKTTQIVEIFGAIIIQLWVDKTNITVSGASKTMAVAPMTSSPPLPPELKGSTYMPIRDVAEALYTKVEWDGAQKKVTLTQEVPGFPKKIIELWINKKQAKIDGVDVWLDKSQKLYPSIVAGKTMLPLRFVGEALGADVAWEAATKKITLTYPKP